MPKHLHFNTTYAQPLAIMDIIQAYTIWAKQNETYLKISEKHVISETVKEIVEEFHVEGKYILTSRILLDPTNPSIILIEKYSTVYNESVSNMDNIKENNDEYLNETTCIRLNAGRNFQDFTFQPTNDGPEDVLPGGGGISSATGNAFYLQYMRDAGMRDRWVTIGSFEDDDENIHTIQIYTEKIGCHFKSVFRDSFTNSTYTGGTAGGFNTNIMLNRISTFISGLGSLI